MAQFTLRISGGDRESLAAPRIELMYNQPDAPKYTSTENGTQTDPAMFVDGNSDARWPQAPCNQAPDHHELLQVCQKEQETLSVKVGKLSNQFAGFEVESFPDTSQLQKTVDFLPREKQEWEKELGWIRSAVQNMKEEMEENSQNTREEIRKIRQSLNNLRKFQSKSHIWGSLTPGQQSQPSQACRAEPVEEPQVAHDPPPPPPIRDSHLRSERKNQSYAPTSLFPLHENDVGRELQPAVRRPANPPADLDFLPRRRSSEGSSPFGAVGDRPGHPPRSSSMPVSANNTWSRSGHCPEVFTLAAAAAAHRHRFSHSPTPSTTPAEGRDDVGSVTTSASRRASDVFSAAEDEVRELSGSPNTDPGDIPGFPPTEQQDAVVAGKGGVDIFHDSDDYDDSDDGHSVPDAPQQDSVDADTSDVFSFEEGAALDPPGSPGAETEDAPAFPPTEQQGVALAGQDWNVGADRHTAGLRLVRTASRELKKLVDAYPNGACDDDGHDVPDTPQQDTADAGVSLREQQPKPSTWPPRLQPRDASARLPIKLFDNYRCPVPAVSRVYMWVPMGLPGPKS